MTFDTLVWILVLFMVYLISVVFNRVRGASTFRRSENAGRRPGWKEKLGTYMAQVRRELESAKAGESKEETGWERILPRKDPGPERAEDTAVTPEPARRMDKKKVPLNFPGAGPHKTSAEPMVPRFGEADVRHSGPLRPGMGFEAKNIPYGKRALRKAVIWSEILGPPSALRDRPPGFHG